jgi:hypothetical protein
MPADCLTQISVDDFLKNFLNTTSNAIFASDLLSP